MGAGRARVVARAYKIIESDAPILSLDDLLQSSKPSAAPGASFPAVLQREMRRPVSTMCCTTSTASSAAFML